MMKIKSNRLGFAFGLTSALLYLGCMVVMIALGKSGTVLLFNSILHGLDVEAIVKMDMNFGAAFIGLLCTVHDQLVHWCADRVVLQRIKVRLLDQWHKHPQWHLLLSFFHSVKVSLAGF